MIWPITPHRYKIISLIGEGGMGKVYLPWTNEQIKMWR